MGVTVFDPITGLATLVNSFLASNSGISVVDGSISLHLSGAGAVSLYDAAVGNPLGIGGGLLLTSGTTPGTSNSSTWFGTDNSGSSGFYNGDADIDAVVNTVFQTQSYDATTLAFSFNLSDPKATSISFDLVFGSDEYPEWVDAFVDCAVVIVDGVNYALFNNDPLHPLSVISPNLAAGYFQDNAGTILPIEYDGVSGRLAIVAPLNSSLTTHTIKIGIADTGDHILDSGLFIANMSAGTNPGSGVVSNPGGGTSGNDSCTGSSKDEFFDLQAGDDTVYAGGGADIIVAGSGNDKVFAGSGNDDLKGDAGDDFLDGGADLDTAVYAGTSGVYSISFNSTTGEYSISGNGEGLDTLVSIEQLKFSDGLFTLSNDGITAKLTAVTQPPPPLSNTAGLVMVSGLAAVGYTLKATVADADGLPGDPAAISWQWYADGTAISGATASTYLVQPADTNHTLWVQATYSDAKGYSEQLFSAGSFVQSLSDGSLAITPMSIEGPTSASVHTPITTLLLRAVELGETPNSAIQKIRAALGVPTAVGTLLSTNAFQILQSGVGDTATALALAKLQVEVAVLCSLSDDQSGLKLTLALLNKASSGGSFDLTKAADLATILSLDPTSFNLADTKTYPQPLKEIFDRTNNIHDASRFLDSSSGFGKSIESEWIDFLSNWDSMQGVPITTLSLAINQGPSGFATATLPSLVAGEEGSFVLTTNQLTQGFHDPDGDPLSVSSLTTDQGDWFSQNADGSWSIDQASPDYDFTYVGPLELSYTLDDGNGHSLDATQLLLVVEHLNHAPTGTVTINGTPTQGETLTASNSLADLDGIPSNGPGAIQYQWSADGIAIIGAAGGAYTLTQADVGKAISVTASYTDGFGQMEQLTSDASAAVANVDDAATGELSVNGSAAEGGFLTASLTNVVDPDGSTTISYRWQQNTGTIEAPIWSDLNATSSSLTIPSDQSLVGKQVRVVVTTTDALGGSTAFIGDPQTIANVNDAPVGTVSITGTPIEGQTLIASSSLTDNDGLGTITYTWFAGGASIGTGNTFTLTSAQVGQAISVTATYTDGQGTGESFSSQATAQVAALVTNSNFSLQGNTYNDGNTRSSGNGAGGYLLISSYTFGDRILIDAGRTYWFIDNTTTADGKTGIGVFLNDGSGSGSKASAWDRRDELLGLITATGFTASQFKLSADGTYFSSSTTPPPPATTPSISLSVAPASVLEDGTTNLVYTFTRSGDTASALTVTFSLAGTASLGTDYTSAGLISGTNQTISFLTGSATATLAVDPTADNTVEANETVELTLTAGSGYTLATSTAVVGTISNDDTSGGSGSSLSFTSNRDILTGTSSSDTFQLTNLNLALLGTTDPVCDRIIGLDANTDRINGPRALTLATAINPHLITTAAVSLNSGDIAKVLTRRTFMADTVAAFTYNDTTTGPRTFLALNNASAGFSSGTDAIIEITGYSGIIASLAVF